MSNKIVVALKKNIFVIICIIILMMLCLYIKHNFGEFVNIVDSNVQTFFKTRMMNKSNTDFMKSITLLGNGIAIVSIFLLSLLLFKNKIVKIVLALNLLLTSGLTLVLKSVYGRARPSLALIELPKSYSFPSGHTLFSVSFYGLIIYFIWKQNISKFYKYILTFIICMIIIYIGISRIYLGVHYFSDVIGGFIFGILILILSIGIFKNYDWKCKI